MVEVTEADIAPLNGGCHGSLTELDHTVEDPLKLIAGKIVVSHITGGDWGEARLGEAGAAELDLWLYKAGVEIVAVDAEQIAVARRAWRSYGKGRHPAGLNYGDCFSYALAKTRNEPLLFKGDDFSRTDIEAA